MNNLIAQTQNHDLVIPKYLLDTTGNQLTVKNDIMGSSMLLCVCVLVYQVIITCVLMWKDNAFHFSFYPVSCYYFSDSTSSLVFLISHFLWSYPSVLIRIFANCQILILLR